jgi:hypothetical protein
LVPLLGFRLCGVEDDVCQRNANLSVLIATGLDGNVDELEEAIHLLGAEFDLDHAEAVLRTTTGSATLTGGGTGTHGNGGAMIGGLI